MTKISETPKISIIIPIYNAELYIFKCIDSILSQSFTDFELLLINDGSVDRSGNICNQFASNDSRINVYHTPNYGVSAARNLGLKKAKGEWVLFVDADDWLENDCLNNFNITANNIEFIQFGIRIHNNNKKSEIIPNVKNVTFYSIQEYEHTVLFRSELWNYLFLNKVIKLNNLSFSENIKYAEDQEFIMKYIPCISNIAIIPNVTYNYLIHNNSTMRKKITHEHLSHNLSVIRNVLSYYKSKGYPIRTITNIFIKNLINCYLRTIYQNKYSIKEINTMKNDFKSLVINNKKLFYNIFYNNTTFKMAYHSIYLYIFIARIFHITKYTSK